MNRSIRNRTGEKLGKAIRPKVRADGAQRHDLTRAQRICAVLFGLKAGMNAADPARWTVGPSSDLPMKL